MSSDMAISTKSHATIHGKSSNRVIAIVGIAMRSDSPQTLNPRQIFPRGEYTWWQTGEICV